MPLRAELGGEVEFFETFTEPPQAAGDFDAKNGQGYKSAKNDGGGGADEPLRREDYEGGTQDGREKGKENDEKLTEDEDEPLPHDVDAAAALAGGLKPGRKKQRGGVGDEKLQRAEYGNNAGEA